MRLRLLTFALLAMNGDGRTLLDTAEEMADSESADPPAARAVLRSAFSE